VYPAPIEYKKKDPLNRIRRSEAELANAAEMVRGGMTFQTASDTYNIPISTIRYYLTLSAIFRLITITGILCPRLGAE